MSAPLIPLRYMRDAGFHPGSPIRMKPDQK
jgi:hypothetical protein